jgi:hypothetical protein
VYVFLTFLSRTWMKCIITIWLFCKLMINATNLSNIGII